MRACLGRVGAFGRQLGVGEDAGMPDPVEGHPKWAWEVQQGAALPPLTEGQLHVVHRWTLYGDLHVVPGRALTKGRCEGHDLRVAQVSAVVGAAEG